MDITFFTVSFDQKQFDRRTKCMKYLKTHRMNLYKDEIAHTNFKKKDAERKKKERVMKKLHLSERDLEKIRTKERERKRRQRAEKKKLVAENPPLSQEEWKEKMRKEKNAVLIRTKRKYQNNYTSTRKSPYSTASGATSHATSSPKRPTTPLKVYKMI